MAASTQKDKEFLMLEERKVKALEKIAVSVNALTIWFEEMDTPGWDARLQFYLAKFLDMSEEDKE
tara:strand:- start:65 stop:259 length:195 start_codon:yes stop_codon:yes gene_type:complete